MGIGISRAGQANGPAVGPRLVEPTLPSVGNAPGSAPLIARALAVIDYSVAELLSAGAAGGIAQVQIDPLPGELVALVDRIFISCDSATATTAGVYVGGTGTRNQRDYAPSGNVNVADLVQPIYVGRNQPLIVRWEGADDGATGIATIQYRICRHLEEPARAVAGLV